VVWFLRNLSGVVPDVSHVTGHLALFRIPEVKRDDMIVIPVLLAANESASPLSGRLAKLSCFVDYALEELAGLVR
jgi:hypothetical protein